MTTKKQWRPGKVREWPGTKFWYLDFLTADLRRVRRSSKRTDKAEAEALLRKIEERIKRHIQTGGASGPLTFKRFAEETWLPGREHLSSWKNDRSRLPHLYPFIGDMPLEAVKYEHIKHAISELWKRVGPEKHQISNRLVRHVYGAARQVFKLALKMELIPSSPCLLDRNEVPPKSDKVKGKKRLLRYSAAELSLLIFDERIPLRRRVLYAFLAFTGSRINEATPRRWLDIDYSFQPMAQVVIATGYNRKEKQETDTKTEVVRIVPLHPTLAAILAEWKLHGWPAQVGHAPGPHDLIFPSPTTGSYLNSNTSLETLHRDLRTLGLREVDPGAVRRDQHSFRRSFVTLFQNAKPVRGDPKVYMLFTHAKPKDEDMLAAYGDFWWETMCEEMSKLVIPRPEGRVVQLPVVAVAGAGIVPSQQTQGGVMIKEISGRGGTRSLPTISNRVSTNRTTPHDSSESSAHNVTKRHGADDAYDKPGTGRNHSAFSLLTELAEVAAELLREHQQTPHEHASCPLCRKAEAALQKARGGA